MKKFSSLFAGISLLTVLLFTSCSKEGTTGPAGATGPAGPAGPAGATGATGAAGTANVIYSGWLDAAFLPDTFRNGTVLDTAGFYTEINAPKLTTALLGTATVSVYWSPNATTSNFVVALPFFNGDYLINTYFSPTLIEVYANGNLSTRTTNGVKTSQFRYVIIPGGAPARSSVDMKNYAEVKKFYNIPD